MTRLTNLQTKPLRCLQIGIGIAIGIDCLTTEYTERHGSIFWNAKVSP